MLGSAHLRVVHVALLIEELAILLRDNMTAFGPGDELGLDAQMAARPDSRLDEAVRDIRDERGGRQQVADVADDTTDGAQALRMPPYVQARGREPERQVARRLRDAPVRERLGSIALAEHAQTEFVGPAIGEHGHECRQIDEGGGQIERSVRGDGPARSARRQKAHVPPRCRENAAGEDLS